MDPCADQEYIVMLTTATNLKKKITETNNPNINTRRKPEPKEKRKAKQTLQSQPKEKERIYNDKNYRVKGRVGMEKD